MLYKKFLVTTFFTFTVILLLFVTTVNAHSTLEQAIPGSGEKVDKTIKEIKLSFSSKIENGSRFSIIDENDEKIEPDSIKITDNILEGTLKQPLKPGTYQVNWKILGVDGHIIENSYSFTVNEKTSKKSEQNSVDNDDKTGVEPNKNNTEETDSNQKGQETVKTSDATEQSPLTYGIIIFLVLALAVLVAWMLFAKRKK